MSGHRSNDPDPGVPSPPFSPPHPQTNPHHHPHAPGTLNAPWRLEYLEALDAKEKRDAASGGAPDTGSFLRDAWLRPDEDTARHVIVRTGHGLIMLNAFPYSNGHLLVALGEARPRLLDYSAPERARLWALTDAAADLLERTLQPQGINIGVNQGRAAGAGVPVHLHVHLVPRWGGDVNFISVVGHVRVIPSSLEAMGARLRAVWAGIGPGWGPALA